MKRLLTLAAAASPLLAAVPLLVVAPQVQAANAETITWDCDDNAVDYHYHYAAAGDTVTIETTDCANYETFDEDHNQVVASTPIPVGGEVVVGPYTEVNIYGVDPYPEVFIVAFLEPETVPSGVLHATETVTLPASPEEFTLPDDGSGDYLLNGDDSCDLQASDGGQHIYATLDVEVTVAGTYTFRGISTDPLSSLLNGAGHPISDPFLALYTTFDPTDPDAGVVGCNDDLNDLYGNIRSYMAEGLSGGRVMEGHLPYFSADLQPGSYTLVLALWETLSAADWAAGTGSYEGDYTPGPASVTFELWGPVDGLCVGSCDTAPTTLPVTGTGSNMPLLAGVAVALGGLCTVIGRRRLAGRVS